MNAIAIRGSGFVLVILLIAPQVEKPEPYFPKHVFYRKDPEQSDDWAKMYSEHLSILREPSLWASSKRDRSVSGYRVLWYTGSTRVEPLCVRVQRRGDQISLRLSQHACEKDGRPGKLSIEREIQISEAQWKRIVALVEESKFWTAPVGVKEQLGFTDGDLVLIEGVRDGKYHVISRLVFTAREPYKDLCRLLIELSGAKGLADWDRLRKQDRSHESYRSNPTETEDLGDP